MKKIPLKKALFVVVGFLFIVVVFLCLNFFNNTESGVKVFDSEDNEVATVTYDGDDFKIKAVSDAYMEYVELSVTQAVELYAQKKKLSTDEMHNVFSKKSVK